MTSRAVAATAEPAADRGETAGHALGTHSAHWLALAGAGWRWLALENDIGSLLWTPIAIPEGITPATVDGLRKLEHRGRVYRRMERDNFVASRVQGRADR